MLAEAGQHLLSRCNPGLQIGASPPVAWPPPRPGLGQLSLEALQSQLFLVAVTPGAVGCGPCDCSRELQRALRLNSRLLHPAAQVAGAGGPHRLGQVGWERTRGRRQGWASFVARPRVAVLTGPVHARRPRSLLKPRFRTRRKRAIAFLGPRFPVLDHLVGDRSVGTVIVLTSISSGRCVDGAGLWR